MALKQRQAVFQVDRKKGQLVLEEVAEGVTVDEVRVKTGADFEIAEGGVGVME